ncbi:hypothetical protein J3F84DRAFT_348650 [Trichoderma pleuroticola]
MVSASFPYATWLDLYEHEKPFKLFIDLPSHVSDQRRTNLIFQHKDTHDVVDVRGDESSFSLDVEGFSFVTHVTSVVNFHDAAQVKEKYFQEVKDILRNNLQDVKRVEVFDWRLRISMSEDDFIKKKINLSNPTEAILPAVYPHIEASAIRRIQHHLPQESQEPITRRCRIINIWRPLETVKNWPLALCDLRTVDRNDLVATDFVHHDYVGETYFLKYNQNHIWHFLSNQKSEEVTLLKIYDSGSSNTIGCPHAAFDLDSDKQLPVRQSIEVRAFVFS